MKNITVAIDDDTYRRARVRAAQRGTSVSALVRRHLAELAAAEDEFERLKRLEAATREKIDRFSASDRVTRDQVHERGAK